MPKQCRMPLISHPIKLGILGAGSFVQRRILPVIEQVADLQVTCIQKRDLSHATQLASQFNIPHAVATRQQLLEHPDVDAVFIATPNACHEEDAIACANAHKATLCEKPLAPTTKAIKQMQKAFYKHGTELFVGHSLRFKPAVQKAKELLSEGKLGDLLLIRAYFTLPIAEDSWRFKQHLAGGALQDIGVHLIDLIHFISQDHMILIQAFADADFGLSLDASDKNVLATGRLSHGALFSFECSIAAPFRCGFELVCTKGHLISLHSLRQTDGPPTPLQWIPTDGAKEEITLPANNIYVDELQHFVHVLQGKCKPIISSDIALINQKLIEAAYTSIQRQKVVHIK